MLTLRRANSDDSKTLWLWRNDPATRSASLNRGLIPWEDHDRWFASAVNDPDRAILVAMNDAGDRLGMVRFDFDTPREATVSINVAPDFRGHGVGRTLLTSAVAWLDDWAPGSAVTAVVRAANGASLRLFECEGFVLTSSDGEFVTLSKSGPAHRA